MRVSLLPRLFEVVGSSVEFDHIDGLTMLGIRRFGLTRSSHVLKRAFDLAGSSVMLLALAPIMAAVAIAIRLDSRGPVLFRQTRIGRDGAAVRDLQVPHDGPGRRGAQARAPHLNETEGLFKIADDPRITRVGGFLRRTALDELPQLLNVWRGEMSLVGPRPLVADEDAKIEGLDRSRLHLTPGMTGHWQILGSGADPAARDGRDRLPLRGQLVAVDGPEDPAPDGARTCSPARGCRADAHESPLDIRLSGYQSVCSGGDRADTPNRNPECRSSSSSSAHGWSSPSSR